jgi:FkbM family methyltransferase
MTRKRLKRELLSANVTKEDLPETVKQSDPSDTGHSGIEGLQKAEAARLHAERQREEAEAARWHAVKRCEMVERELGLVGDFNRSIVLCLLANIDDRGFIRVMLNDMDLRIPPMTIRTMIHCVHAGKSGEAIIDIERAHFDWIKEKLRPQSYFIDVGSATGAMCLPLAKQFGASVSIIAFEPASAARTLLASTIARNDLTSIRILPMACSDAPGKATFYEFSQDDTGKTPFLPETSTLAVQNDPRAHETLVELTTLDIQLAGNEKIQHAVVKIDVEGFEAKVLRGAQEFLTRLRPALAIDIHANPFGAGTTERDVRELLQPLGYKMEKIAHVLICDPK